MVPSALAEGEKRLAQNSDCSRWTLRAKSKIHRDRNLAVSREKKCIVVSNYSILVVRAWCKETETN